MTTEFLPVADEVHLSSRGRAPVIVGYAAVFESRSAVLSPRMSAGRSATEFVEIVDRQAFERTLASGDFDVTACFNHDDGAEIGRQSAGSLELRTNRTGLHYEITVTNQQGHDTAALIARGDVYGSSFRFNAATAGDTWTVEDGQVVRRLHDVDLYEVGPVLSPAYPAATSDVAMRSLAEARSLPYEEVIEARDAGRLVDVVRLTPLGDRNYFGPGRYVL